jgi:hypothetical protein
LAAIGTGLLSGYALLARLYPLRPSLYELRGAWTRLVDPTWQNAGRHIAIYLGLTLLYLAALRLLNSSQPVAMTPSSSRLTGRRVQIGLIYIIWLGCSLVALTIAPAGESRDIFDYLFRGRMMAEFGGNPLAEVPKSYSSTSFYRYLAWHSHVDTYGPLWELSSLGVSLVVRQAVDLLAPPLEAAPSCPKSLDSCSFLAATISGYRLLAILLVGLSGILIASMVNRSKPELVAAALAAWLWCPLTIIATAVGAHNDGVMILLLLLGVWLMQRQQPFGALIALILAAHIKLTAFIWLPVFAVWIVYRWGWSRLLQAGLTSVAVGLGVSWLLYAPFEGWGTLPRMLRERSLYHANSFWSALYLMLYKQWGWSKEIARRLTVDMPSVLFLFGASWLSWRLLRSRRGRLVGGSPAGGEADRPFWSALLSVSMLYLLVGSFWFQHWYVLWALAPAALLPGSAFTRTILPWLSFGALSANVLADFLAAIAPDLLSPPVFALVVFATIWLPALVAGLIYNLGARGRGQVMPRMPENPLAGS